jgi:hypothetical protein
MGQQGDGRHDDAARHDEDASTTTLIG